ncbi:DNA-binding response regulator [Pseudonocardiaceae bacterium YIM PH 21723]|nr:DNA-binding response regulator [Pseudonocardiaceae bacterium YIM PH 21723]
MAVRLLVVEDDVRVSQALELALTDEGYAVTCVGTGEEAMVHIAAGLPEIDVVLLDVMLPDIDGLTLCRRIREQGDVPVIMVTALSDTKDVIAGLECGADDYVSKPVDAGELSARIKAVLRRAGTVVDPDSLIVGDIELYTDQGRAFRAGAEIQLTKTEFRLLRELALARGNVVSREELLERVWESDYFDDSRLLDVHIRRLRRKVEDDPGQPTHVLTVRGFGYRVAA